VGGRGTAPVVIGHLASLIADEATSIEGGR
jgi:hypothetical protein